MAALSGPLFRAIRAQAIEQLRLRAGDRVLDIGCGTGANFPYLQAAVGPSGHVVGVEISPFLAAKARHYVQQQGWRNVHVITAAAQSVSLAKQFDGLLLFAVHEALTSPEALDNLLAHLNGRARVVAFGAKQVPFLPGRLLNPLLRLASKKWLPGATPINSAPWRLLADRVDQLVLEEHVAGLLYTVVGTLITPPV